MTEELISDKITYLVRISAGKRWTIWTYNELIRNAKSDLWICSNEPERETLSGFALIEGISVDVVINPNPEMLMNKSFHYIRLVRMLEIE